MSSGSVQPGLSAIRLRSSRRPCATSLQPDDGTTLIRSASGGVMTMRKSDRSTHRTPARSIRARRPLLSIALALAAVRN